MDEPYIELWKGSDERQIELRRRLRRRFLFLSVAVPAICGPLLFVALDEHDMLPTLAYMLGAPMLLALVPFLFSETETLDSYRTLVFQPFLSAFIAFAVLMVTRLEALACIMFITVPFILGGFIILFIARLAVRWWGRRRGLQVSLLVPIAVMSCGAMLERSEEARHVERTVVVRSDPATIFEHVTRVRTISHDEIDRGFWNRLGVPAPIEATIDRDGVGGTRIGHFEHGLRFIERIVAWEPGRFIELSVEVDPSSLTDPRIDRHALTGSYFAFGRVSYRIDPLTDGTSRVTLACSYRLHSSVNRYCALWGDAVIGDFEERLLEVIAKRCEKAASRSEAGGC